MDDLLRLWARAAQRLNLNALNVTESSEEEVRQFDVLVLEELAARGLLEGPQTLDCWAALRQQEN